MDYLSHYDSPLGGITMASDGIGLVGLWFDGQKYFAEALDEKHEVLERHPVFDQTRQWLDAYFGGRIPDFMPSIVMRGTAFRRQVWEILLTIPYGATVTYGDIAKRIGVRSPQAVGGAVGHNPILLIVPCHRVVGADGSLTGYAGGPERKKWLVEWEERCSKSRS